MRYQDKQRIAYYAALSILFGSIELFIPKLLPFFRLGLSNIPMFLALDMPLHSFLLLATLKALGNSYISGNIFSFFVLISLSQSLISALLMWLLKRTGLFSNYGLSISGAGASAVTQLAVSSLYIGNSVFSFLPLMLASSLATSIAVAFFSYRVEALRIPPEIKGEEDVKTGSAIVLSLIVSLIAVMAVNHLASLIALALLSFLLQIKSGRKLKIIPHLTIAAFMVFSALLSPEGRVLGTIGSFMITEGALLDGIAKAIRLSSTVALSQAYSPMLRPGKNLLGDTLKYSTSLFSAFEKQEGTIENRVLATLSLKSLEAKEPKKREARPFYVVFSVLFLAIAFLEKLMF